MHAKTVIEMVIIYVVELCHSACMYIACLYGVIFFIMHYAFEH